MKPHPKNKRTSQLFHKVKTAICEHHMLNHGDGVIVGVSGGADSVALLYTLLHLKPELKIDIAAAHLNHGLRGSDSDADARFVGKLCKKLDISLFSKKVDVQAFKKKWGRSLEETSRIIRYEFFSSLLTDNPYQKIALGHHMDDNVELVFMNLIRGSGATGISGIPPARDNQFIRPLYNLTRREIEAFLEENRINHMVDESNQDQAFLRNRIRHELLPFIKDRYNPNIVAGLHRFTEIMREEEAWLDRSARSFYNKCRIEENENKIFLSVDRLNKLHLAVKRRVLRIAIKSIKGKLRRISFTHIDDAVRLLESDDPSSEICLPQGTRIYRCYGKLIVSNGGAGSEKKTGPHRHPITPVKFSYKVNRPCGSRITVDIPEVGARIKFYEINVTDVTGLHHTERHKAFFDLKKLLFPLMVRNIEPGDRFTPFGMTGSQKVKSFFINNKIPRLQRKKTPVVLSGTKIIWLAGFRIDESFKIEDKAPRILCAEFSYRFTGLE